MADADERLLAKLDALHLTKAGTQGQHTFGDYAVESTLGKGACAVVKKCRHKPSNSVYAVKMLNRGELDRNPTQRRRTDNEIALLKRLSHPAICKLKEVVDVGQERMVVLEYLPKGELYDVILRRGKMTPADAYWHFYQVVAALTYLKVRDIAHRDIKLENILLDAAGQARLCDFGFALQMKDEKLIKYQCGSPHYAAPEVIRGDLCDPFAADVWSLGVVLFTMVAGKLPFCHDDVNVMLNLIEQQPASSIIPPDLPRPLRDLLCQMLQVDPRARIPLNDIPKSEWWLAQSQKLSTGERAELADLGL